MSTREIRVAATDQVREGQLHAVEAEGNRLLLTRIDGQVKAVINRCPHLGMKMTKGKLSDGVLQCPWHGSRFDFCTGANLDWVNAFAGVPLPKWTHGLIAMGKSPGPLTTVPIAERDQQVYATIGD